jgi:hypothetical protein
MRQTNDAACYCRSVLAVHYSPMGRSPTVANESNAMRRTITIEFDSTDLESFSDESLRYLICKALTSSHHWNPIANSIRIEN